MSRMAVTSVCQGCLLDGLFPSARAKYFGWSLTKSHNSVEDGAYGSAHCHTGVVGFEADHGKTLHTTVCERRFNMYVQRLAKKCVQEKAACVKTAQKPRKRALDPGCKLR